ncbi:DUF2069 domain-containing protein [Bordetella genomosp. 11]|uniref:DUF2069 domain-containing protein n=1 Tax=Bordetella genomosp. 11 TaxID=1416808 RepID=A0A261UGG1_9BORD|nr:DUF2069 domain-containing protein [Bordetella genomosp. 11]OZI59973.1 hypothetical protein CAL28_10860 [Bordetella genomosp. 11]
MDIELNRNLRLTCVATLLCLTLLCVLWETVLAPVRPGGSWLFLKALPLAFPLRGILRGNLYTYQWASMLILLYVMEGAVRALSDTLPLSAMLAGVELALALTFFACAILYVRPAKQAARRRRSSAT